jgi:hypothetical protein
MAGKKSGDTASATSAKKSWRDRLRLREDREDKAPKIRKPKADKKGKKEASAKDDAPAEPPTQHGRKKSDNKGHQKTPKVGSHPALDPAVGTSGRSRVTFDAPAAPLDKGKGKTVAFEEPPPSFAGGGSSEGSAETAILDPSGGTSYGKAPPAPAKKSKTKAAAAATPKPPPVANDDDDDGESEKSGKTRRPLRDRPDDDDTRYYNSLYEKYRNEPWWGSGPDDRMPPPSRQGFDLYITRKPHPRSEQELAALHAKFGALDEATRDRTSKKLIQHLYAWWAKYGLQADPPNIAASRALVAARDSVVKEHRMSSKTRKKVVDALAMYNPSEMML